MMKSLSPIKQDCPSPSTNVSRVLDPKYGERNGDVLGRSEAQGCVLPHVPGIDVTGSYKEVDSASEDEVIPDEVDGNQVDDNEVSAGFVGAGSQHMKTAQIYEESCFRAEDKVSSEEEVSEGGETDSGEEDSEEVGTHYKD
ncbi:hypothetical protein U1Q18_009774 [Sarracenia purpurea var. burkii]